MELKWDEKKNEWLKKEREISFEEIAVYIKNNNYIDLIDHPNQIYYPNQYIYMININNYVYEVPHIIDYKNNHIFLKTIIPSRKWTKYYLNK